MKILILLFLPLMCKTQTICIVQANCKQTVTPPDVPLLFGQAQSTDGIKSVLWTWVSGPIKPALSTPNNMQTVVLGTVPGTYIFSFSAVTNSGGNQSVPDTLVVLPFRDYIDSVRVYWHSGKLNISNRNEGMYRSSKRKK